MENLNKSSEKPLNKRQRKAIEMLVYQGLSKSEAARELKITPQTLSVWLNPNKTPNFVEAYEKELETAENMRKRNYKAVAQKAVDKMIELVDCNNEKVAFQACKDLLDRAGDKPEDNINIGGKVSEKLADIFSQIGGEGLEE